MGVVVTGPSSILSRGDPRDYWEELVELPPCPLCKNGHMLPLSAMHNPFSSWICSAPNCAYVISRDPAGATYYKGIASTQDKEKGGKTWTEYQF
jgi:hypothetical protein